MRTIAILVLLAGQALGQSDDTALPVAPISPRMSNILDQVLALNDNYVLATNSVQWFLPVEVMTNICGLLTNYTQLAGAIGSDCLHWNISNINVSVAVVTNVAWSNCMDQLYYIADQENDISKAIDMMIKVLNENKVIKHVTTLYLMWNGQPCGWQTEVVLDRKPEKWKLKEEWIKE